MEAAHLLRYYGNYSFADVMEMTAHEHTWLLNRLERQFKSEGR
jgi:hypothetical protein